MVINAAKSLSIFWVYVFFSSLGAARFAISLATASPELQSLAHIFVPVVVAFTIVGGVLAWFAQKGAKWALATFGVYCLYRIGDYIWGHFFLDEMPQSLSGWALATIVIFGWAFLGWLVVEKSSGKTASVCSSPPGMDDPV